MIRLIMMCVFACSTVALGQSLPCHLHPTSELTEVPPEFPLGVIQDGDTTTLFLHQDAYVYDMSDPSSPQFIGTHDYTIIPRYVSGDLAFVTINGDLFIHDYTDRENPIELSRFYTQSADFVDFYVRDDILYIANDDLSITRNALIVVDISDPSNPTEITRFVGNYAASDIEVQGDLLYVPTDDNGLAVFDISTPHDPQLLIQEPGLFRAPPSRLYIEGTTLYALIGTFFFASVDVEDIQNMTQISEIETERMSWVAFANGWFYMTNTSRELSIYDATDPANPILSLVTELGSSSSPRLFSGDGFALLATLNEHPRVFTINEPLPVRQVLDVEDDILVRHFAHGSYAFTILDETLTIYERDDSGEYTMLGDYTHTDELVSLVPNGNYLYVGESDYNDPTLLIIDIADPTNPALVDSFYPIGTPHEMQIYGDRLVIRTAGSSVWTYDISNPTSPYNLRVLGEAYDPKGMTIGNDTIFVADARNGLKVFNIADRFEPVLISTIEPNSVSIPSVVFADNILYFNDGGHGIRIFDVSDPATPIELSAIYPDPGDVGSLIYRDGLIINNADGVSLIDVRDPTQPVHFGTIERYTDAVLIQGSALVTRRDPFTWAVLDLHEFPIAFECSTCHPDFNADGAVNFFDLAAFLEAYINEDPIADLNSDSAFNFFDITAFIELFTAGCP